MSAMTASLGKVRLFNYWRSSASWRVRIALGLKGIEYEYVPVHLVKDGGQQRAGEHKARNPMEQVPALELELGGTRRVVAQSIAILELLEELVPAPALLPKDLYLRARVRELAELVNAGIQPHQNLTPTARLDAVKEGLGKAHAKHFNEVGMRALDERAKDTAGKFLVGDTPTFADVCMVPQMYSARRFGADVSGLALLQRVEATCNELPAFAAAHPDEQPDAGG